MSSLWSVDDEATGKLMVRFYQLLKAGRRKDDALKSAMSSFLEGASAAKPKLWAAFQLSGDPAPLREVAADK